MASLVHQWFKSISPTQQSCEEQVICQAVKKKLTEISMQQENPSFNMAKRQVRHAFGPREWVADHPQVPSVGPTGPPMGPPTGPATVPATVPATAQTFAPGRSPPASQDMYNMIQNQVFMKQKHQKKIWDLTHIINQQNAEINKMAIHNQLATNATAAMVEQIWSLESMVLMYEQNRVALDGRAYMELQRQLTARDEWLQSTLEKYVLQCFTYVTVKKHCPKRK